MGVFKRLHHEGGQEIRKLRNIPWIFWGIVFGLCASVIFSCFYGYFRANARKRIWSPTETSDNISWLYLNCYLLYKDLYNAQRETSANYAELYLKLDSDYAWISGRSRNDVLYEAEQNGTKFVGDGGAGMLTLNEYTCIMDEMENLESMFMNLESSFSKLNADYDYSIRDLDTGTEITNMSVDDKNRSMSDNFFYLVFEFDANGNAAVGDKMCGQDTALIRKYASEAARESIFQKTEESGMQLLERYGTLKTPRNCAVTFAVPESALRSEFSDTYFIAYYRYSGADEALFAAMAVMLLAGFFLPVFRKTKPWTESKLCSIPFEVLFTAGIILCSLNGEVCSMVSNLLNGNMGNGIREVLRISPYSAELLAFGVNLLGLGLYFFGWWYIGVCARAVREYGIRGYIRKRSLIYRFFPFIKRKISGIYHKITHLDLTRNVHRTIIRLVIVNAVILSAISFFWIGGVGLVVVYSLVLYVILRKYVSDLQDKYKVLLEATNEMAEGRLDVSINEDLGVFEPFKPQVLKIQEGFQKAVDQEVRSQRMKAELITNVSHDLKTPLTAIITYINLLKEDNVTETQRREYVETLERKSLRLKSLIEDLFEVSKATSQNITLNLMDVDIMNLVKQVEFEMSDKLGAANLDIRMNLTDERIILNLDSQKTYRIFENLFGNVAKYAMPGTRVYVNGFCVDDKVLITIKNISAQEITVDSAELMERFVRGDASRNTEGSGLGLAIAKSFTELQGGGLSLEVDGDLFKATVSWTLP